MVRWPSGKAADCRSADPAFESRSDLIPFSSSPPFSFHVAGGQHYPPHLESLDALACGPHSRRARPITQGKGASGGQPYEQRIEAAALPPGKLKSVLWCFKIATMGAPVAAPLALAKALAAVPWSRRGGRVPAKGTRSSRVKRLQLHTRERRERETDRRRRGYGRDGRRRARRGAEDPQ